MEMEEERIGLVLVRVTELHSKIASRIPNPHQSQPHINVDSPQNGEETDEETDTLLNICRSFESLESQLSSLQALRQQQQYEREAVISDIEYNRKMLLKKLSEYKGEHLDVIQEAEAFASMKVEHDNELLLPPYPAPSPHSLVLDKSYLSRAPHSCKFKQNDLDGGNESTESQNQSKSNKLWGGLKYLAHSTAKTVVTLVGVFSLLSLAGFEPKLQKKGTSLNVLTLLHQPGDKNRALVARCPPGKVPVMEGGDVRCIVKERVEIPFDSVADNPDVNYGCG